MAAKPYHAGHDGLVRIAAGECDHVKLYISTSDRIRKGEIKISGAAMEYIWKEFIIRTLPDNVEPIYGKVTVRNVYEDLQAAEDEASLDVHILYGDEHDVENEFPDKSLEKYVPNLFKNGQIIKRGVMRTETVPVSGTKMRELIAMGDEVNFKKFLPKQLQKYANRIFSLLTNSEL